MPFFLVEGNPLVEREGSLNPGVGSGCSTIGPSLGFSLDQSGSCMVI